VTFDGLLPLRVGDWSSLTHEDSVARIRRLIISNFRSIQALDWVPAPGINCLIGPGDSGKSSILDAIDLCVGARRGGTFGDMDFFALNVETPITISVTLGDLQVSLMDIDVYGEFLRGFNPGTGEVEDEPRAGLETVITLLLQVGADLEPTWTLFLSVRSSSNSNALFPGRNERH
jgi:hypothetical protein